MNKIDERLATAFILAMSMTEYHRPEYNKPHRVEKTEDERWEEYKKEQAKKRGEAV